MLIRRPRLTGLNVRSRSCMLGQLCSNPVFKNSPGIVLFKINITQGPGYVVLKVFMTIAVFLLFILLKNNNNWENRLRYVTQNTSKTIFGLTDLHEVFKLQLKVLIWLILLKVLFLYYKIITTKIFFFSGKPSFSVTRELSDVDQEILQSSICCLLCQIYKSKLFVSKVR